MCLMANTRKVLLCHLQARKALTGMHICAVRSEPSQFVNVFNSIHWFFKQAMKALIKLHKCTGILFPCLYVCQSLWLLCFGFFLLSCKIHVIYQNADIASQGYLISTSCHFLLHIAHHFLFQTYLAWRLEGKWSLTLKAPTATAADDILNCMYFHLLQFYLAF